MVVKDPSLAICLFDEMGQGFRCLSEGEAATESVWLDRFGGDSQIFTALLADGILRNSGLSLGRRNFTLNFVGLLSIGSAIWFAFPKASKDRSWDDADIILRAIIEYRGKVARSPVSVDFSATTDRFYDGTLVDTFTALVLWTLDHGFHRQAAADGRSIYEGIDWARTIRSTIAMHSNASVVYPFPVTRIQSQRLSQLAELQAHALLDMRHRLGAFAPIIAPHADDLWERCMDVIEHGNTVLHLDSIERTIKDHAGSTNRDEDLELIGLLKDWQGENWFSGPRLSAYGISAFHTVWEDMCTQAVASLGECVSHTEMASQPSYLVQNQNIKLKSQRPDILLKLSSSVLLADAKWYLLDDSALPQTSDAIKQFAYELSINASTHVDANLLLLPTESERPWNVAGILQMSNAEGRDFRFKPISIVALNWRYLARLYVDRQCLPEEFIADMIALRSPDCGIELKQQAVTE